MFKVCHCHLKNKCILSMCEGSSCPALTIKYNPTCIGVYINDMRFFPSRALPLGPDQLLLRGAMLRNTKWIFGKPTTLTSTLKNKK